MSEFHGENGLPPLPPLDAREQRKRKREWIAIGALVLLFVVLTIAEFRLTRVSNTLPFVNSIFFFGLLNVNLIILLALVWLVFRNIGKLFLERRRRLLGARLKTKLVIAFLAFSIIPTLMLFVISAMYINSSFDKWFSLKIQNTLQASLEITRTYYRNADQTANHFAEHLANGVSKRLKPENISHNGLFRQFPSWLDDYLESQRELLAIDAVEYYPDPLGERFLARRPQLEGSSPPYPRLALDLLDQAFSGQTVSVIQHIGTGDLIRSLVPVNAKGLPSGSHQSVAGVVVVSAYIPVSLVNKIDEIASVFDDYKDTNPLKHPMKTTYLVILIMMTLVIIFVAIWIGLYMARELTVPLARLVQGAQAVGAGDLDVKIEGTGHDEIAVVVDSFNKMTTDLKENRGRLTQASQDLEKRRMQLEAVLANVGTGVIVVDRLGKISTFNRAVSELLSLRPELALHQRYEEVLDHDAAPLVDLITRALQATQASFEQQPHTAQWNFRSDEKLKALAAVATPLRDSQGSASWGVVVAIDDMTHLIKGQREMAWREVARRIAHEIKNPLTPIKLSAQRMQRRLSNYGDRDGAILKECTDTIIKHTDELKEMVNEFSNFARFPEASPAPHNLNEAIREVTTLYVQAHPAIRFRFNAESRLPVFEFDRDQIKRVIINLMNNAVAVLSDLPRGAPLSVDLETHYNEQLQMAVITVKDSGPGMTDEVKARLFEPYFSTKREGTGLGLAIAKRIVNDHDGFIRVQSAPGEGTLFSIELPTAPRHDLAGKVSKFDT